MRAVDHHLPQIDRRCQQDRADDRGDQQEVDAADHTQRRAVGRRVLWQMALAAIDDGVHHEEHSQQHANDEQRRQQQVHGGPEEAHPAQEAQEQRRVAQWRQRTPGIGHEEDEEHEDVDVVLAVIVRPQQRPDHDHRSTRGADDGGKCCANREDRRVGGGRAAQVAAHHDATGHGEQCQEQQDEGDIFHQRRVHQRLARCAQAARHHDGDQRQQCPEGRHLAAVVVPEVMRHERKDGD